MRVGILSLPVLPVRSEPSERSEMTTQLLFGEQFEWLENQDNWTLIRNQADGYEGWATTKMLTMLSEEFTKKLNQYQTLLLQEPITVFQGVDVGAIYLPAGSRLFVQGNRLFFPTGEILTELFLDKEAVGSQFTKSLPERILQTANQFLNAPYLWGGKTILGMDCSGLTQVSASINGFQLPRDACDQALLGEEEFLSLSLPGDLAFFANPEGRIVHVGLVFGQNQILHASGSVRLDDLDERGIYNKELKKYTHQLHSIKRIFHS